MPFPALLMRLLLSALLIVSGSVDARAVVGMAVHAAADDSRQPPAAAMQGHCGHARAAAQGHETMVAAHGGGHAEQGDPKRQPAAQPDCGGEQGCSHACHVHACSAAAMPAPPQPVVFERGQDLFPGSDALRAAPPSHQPLRPPIG